MKALNVQQVEQVNGGNRILKEVAKETGRAIATSAVGKAVGRWYEKQKSGSKHPRPGTSRVDQKEREDSYRNTMRELRGY
ncbi:hypothetical protein NFC81_15115 [Salinispirillum sp. LH 10-3-1]|uniref:Uncharacterized protein n=1 Tax=Salinispirillum sp. LH 10-3-1 TaxID=2952525 RepID=A0AB38YF72_9GAMM